MFNDLETSMRRAEERLGQAAVSPRADRGRSRLDPEIATFLQALWDGIEKPSMREVTAALTAFCRAGAKRVPSRATLYHTMAQAPLPRHLIQTLPSEVRATLFNMADDGEVPGDQLVFHCFNYGGTKAMSFAAGLPWRQLWVARQKRGWRAKSHGVLEAVMRARNL